MFCETSKLRARKKLLYSTEPWGVFKDYDIHGVQTLEKRFKTWAAFP